MSDCLRKLRSYSEGEEGLYPFRHPVSTMCWQIKKTAFLKELCGYHVSGQLKVAPEHVSDPVLQMMGKPEHAVYLKPLCRNIRRHESEAGHEDSTWCPI